MDASNGIDIVKTNTRKRTFDLFRPVSVKSDGRRIQSANWCVRFQHHGKRTCRSLGTADFRRATQLAKRLVTSVRQHGWTGATLLPTNQTRVAIPTLLEQFHRSAVSRGLRPRSIAHAEQDLRRVAREIGACRLNDLTPAALQNLIRDSRLKPITLRSSSRMPGVCSRGRLSKRWGWRSWRIPSPGWSAPKSTGSRSRRPVELGFSNSCGKGSKN